MAKRVFFDYSQGDLETALVELKENENKISIQAVAKKYNIPYATLRRRHFNGNENKERKMGPPTILTKEEETLLENWVLSSAKRNFPITKDILCETVKEILDENDRTTPFTNNLPGRKWFQSYLKRHPIVAERYSESVNRAKAKASEEDIRAWHQDLSNFLKQEGHLDILDAPNRIFNADESGFAICPKKGKILGPRGFKNVYTLQNGNEKENISVLATLCANGAMLPPLVIFPYERIPKEISMGMPQSWNIGKSNSGWMTGEVFRGFIRYSLMPFIEKNNIKLPVIFLVDGYKFHLTLNVIEHCREKGIILYSFMANTTHILQPVEVSVFKPLKDGWKEIEEAWKAENNNQTVTRVVFSRILERVLENIKDIIIENGFRNCGIYPFDESAIDYTKCVPYENRNTVIVQKEEFGLQQMLFLESLISPQRIEEFKRSGLEWTGDESAKELFEVWRKLRSAVDGGSNAELEMEQNQSDCNDSPNWQNVVIKEEYDGFDPDSNIKTEEPEIFPTDDTPPCSFSFEICEKIKEEPPDDADETMDECAHLRTNSCDIIPQQSVNSEIAPNSDVTEVNKEKEFWDNVNITGTSKAESSVKRVNKCDECGKTFSQKSDLKRHLRTHYGVKPYECNDCGKAYGDKQTLKNHLRVHTGEEKPYKCNECEKKFSSKSYLQVHLRLHTGEKPFKCETCGKMYNLKKNLIYHYQVHSGKKPCTCKICGKGFSQKLHLNNHLKIHSGIKAYKCEDCGKTFTEKCNLTSHQRVHSGEKPYKCNICEKGFGQKVHLLTHNRVHTGEKPFKCDHCEKSFAQNSLLTTHLKIHSENPFYECQDCGKVYSTKKNYNNHLQTHSGDKQEKDSSSSGEKKFDSLRKCLEM